MMQATDRRRGEMNRAELELFQKHAETCCIFCNQKRLMIMWTLGEGEKPVGQIARELDLSPQAVSQHLRLMKDRGVVASSRRGRQIFYRMANPKFLEAHRMIRSALITKSK
jgi:DNA-binding transcriptional ArsR family regulator